MRQAGERRVKPCWQLLWGRHPYCWICGDWVHPREASVDHLIPLSRGGQDDLRNCALAHRDCNSMRGDDLPPPETLRRIMEWWGWAPVHDFVEVAPELRAILQEVDAGIVF